MVIKGIEWNEMYLSRERNGMEWNEIKKILFGCFKIKEWK